MKKRWPDGYRNWQGTFEDLVATAQAIQAEMDPGSKPLNARLLRHYQAEGAVGRGVKTGRSSQFGYADLVSAVAAKGLVGEGWSLRQSASLLSNTPTDAVAALVSSRNDPSGEPENDAMRLVRELMGSSSEASRSAFAAPRLMGQVQAVRGAAPSASFGLPRSAACPVSPRPASSLPTNCLTAAAITPWLSLSIDEAACAQAAPAEREAAACALEVWARRLR